MDNEEIDSDGYNPPSDWYTVWKRVNTTGFKALLFIGGTLIASVFILAVLMPSDAGVKASIIAAGIPAVLTFLVVVIQATVSKQMADIMERQESEMTRQRKASENQAKTAEKQWFAMQEALVETRALIGQGKRHERAYLGVNWVRLNAPLETGQEPIVELQILNGGRSPAWRVTASLNWATSDQARPEEIMRRYQPQFGRVDIPEYVGILQANGEHSFPPVRLRGFARHGPEFLEAITSRKTNFYVLGNIEYSDINGDVHTYELVAVFDSTTGLIAEWPSDRPHGFYRDAHPFAQEETN